MARTWSGLKKYVEECGEGIVEAAKLMVFPNGKHPARKRNLILSLEDELADQLAAINYLIDRNGLDRKRIEKRAKGKYTKFAGWWGWPKGFVSVKKGKDSKPKKKSGAKA
jgi:hypothetical protein